MRTTHLLTVIGALMLWPSAARAQGVEAGAGIALSCTGTDGVPCTDVLGRATSVYGGWWVSQAIEIELRGTRLDGPDSRIVADCDHFSPNQITCRNYTLRREERRLVQASFIYHFRSGGRVRPFAGGGLGYLWWEGEATCEMMSARCYEVLPNGQPGPFTDRGAVIAVTGGVAFLAGRGVTIRSGVRENGSLKAFRDRGSHNGRSQSESRLHLPEVFVSVGYRW